ncbi:MAG: Thymidine kinase [Candidatus Yanofskybacteria bacterium GW2011_GWA1_41_6]|uniref:Thymidine kinase n=1 Tax=Candidatus Yanofskybacteria bacterium GW2011_GWA1_41_6 TaxID=1619020 RepID=A0A0G0YW51_9BACT|nr:MAG: Thymidine kinase [Candidatus Yanofskybacteria bacterium GW2011_GWA1_41_6]
MPQEGEILVITGPMRGKKSDLLIIELEQARIAEKRVLAFKPAQDTRTADEIVSRKFNKQGLPEISRRFPATIVSMPSDMKKAIDLRHPEIIGIDESQFLSPEFVPFIKEMSDRFGIEFVISGLDMDYLGNPFGETMPGLLAIAHKVIKTMAICYRCKSRQAIFTQKIAGSIAQVEIGDTEYRAACRNCWYPYGGEASRASI